MDRTWLTCCTARLVFMAWTGGWGGGSAGGGIQILICYYIIQRFNTNNKTIFNDHSLRIARKGFRHAGPHDPQGLGMQDLMSPRV